MEKNCKKNYFTQITLVTLLLSNNYSLEPNKFNLNLVNCV